MGSWQAEYQEGSLPAVGWVQAQGQIKSHFYCLLLPAGCWRQWLR